MAHNEPSNGPSSLENRSTPTTGRPWPWPQFPREDGPSTGIDQKTYHNLVLYTKYASAAYQPMCPRPMGNTLIGQFTSVVTTTRGFVARDDKRKEIVVAFRGSKDVISILIDGSVILTPLQGTGLPPSHVQSTPSKNPKRPHVHTGFLIAYQSIAQILLDIVGLQINMYPMYAVVVTGHSLGGAVASIASIAIRNTYPAATVRLYTIGQPRTGDSAYAALVEKMVGSENVYRGVHSIDGVPTMIPTSLGYQHHATEYWQFMELPAPEHVKRCRGNEDPEGSASIPSSGVNPAHWIYFGQPIASDPSVCF
ncbi:Alpha/Beta hydrolase protein [Pisolithus tinctorius]|nr:Alpha/Beta hydrolase protein [Pisolithus tinctorius]